MRVIEESERAGLKLNIKKKKKQLRSRHMEKVEAVTEFLFLGSKITVDGDSSHEIRRHLLLGRKAMTNPDSVLKSRHYSPDKDPYSQGCGLPSGHIGL